MKNIVTFVVRKKLDISQAINHARLSQSLKSASFSFSSFFSSFFLCNLTPYFIRLEEAIARYWYRNETRSPADSFCLRIIALRSITRPFWDSQLDRNGRTNELTVASPRGPVSSGISISGVRDTRQSRDPQPRGGPRYPRYVSTPARSWRESHVVPRDPFDKV